MDLSVSEVYQTNESVFDSPCRAVVALLFNLHIGDDLQGLWPKVEHNDVTVVELMALQDGLTFA